MGRCIYCGLPAGFFRKHHQPCKDQHDHALARIPDFVQRFLESDLPAGRFCQLLEEGARASFITEQELSQAVTRGISNAVDRPLEDRLLNEQELERFWSVTDELGPVLTHNSSVREKLAKLNVLLQLMEGTVPEAVDVHGDLPIDLRRGETVVWIFNNVQLFREETDQPVPEQSPHGELALDAYIRPSAVNSAKMVRSKLWREARGDVIITNRNLFFVQSADQITRLQFARIGNLRAFADGLEIISEAGKRRVFVLDDVWFGANLLARLLYLTRH